MELEFQIALKLHIKSRWLTKKCCLPSELEDENESDNDEVYLDDYYCYYYRGVQASFDDFLVSKIFG